MPLQDERGIDPYRVFDEWEGLLYAMALAFSFEEMHKIYVTIRYFSWRALGFWTAVSVVRWHQPVILTSLLSPTSRSQTLSS